MPLTTKLIADYVELINAQLDSLPAEKIEDFEQIAEALKSITESNQPHTVLPSLQDRVKAIKDIIDFPEDYVQDSANFSEFKGVILTRIAKKIEELGNLTLEERERIIADQRKIQDVAASNHALMCEHKPPAVDSEAHVDTSNPSDLLEILSQVFGPGFSRRQAPPASFDVDSAFAANLRRGFQSQPPVETISAPRVAQRSQPAPASFDVDSAFAANLQRGFQSQPRVEAASAPRVGQGSQPTSSSTESQAGFCCIT